MFEKIYGNEPEKNSCFCKWYYFFIKPFKLKYFFYSFVRIILEGTGLLIPFLIGKLIDIVQFSNLEIDIMKIYLYVGLIFLVQSISYIIFYLNKEEPILRNLIKRQMGVYCLERTLNLNLNWHNQEDSGNKLGRIMNSRDGFDNVLKLFSRHFLKLISRVLFISVIIFISTPFVFLIFFLSYIFIYLFLAFKTNNWMFKYLDIVNKYYEEIVGKSFQYTLSILTIKTFNLIEFVIKKVWKSEKHQQINMRKLINVVFLRFFILNNLNNIFFILIIVYSVYLVKIGDLGIGVLVMLIWYLRDISQVLIDFADIQEQFLENKEKFLRIRKHFSKNNFEKKKIKLKKNWNLIKFNNIDFRYKNKFIFKNFNLEIKNGEKIALVGKSGSGKSTLIKLLLNHYNLDNGKILFDNQDISKVQVNNYLKQFSVVLQELELFNMSVEENILLNWKKNRRNILEKSLNLSYSKDFVSKLSLKEKSLIGENGIKLSGGEKQRISIARFFANLFYNNSKILVLDEPTSFLDNNIEKIILKHFKKIWSNKTVFFVSHKLRVIKDFDRILVFNNGQIIEEGKFKELINKRGYFYDLWKKEN